ncbi:MAG TPA: hypothetical protein VNU97_15205 [Rhizomicrobium sp.]|jgi:hypothetical protein|nr:hypothetical protein [Rhizomicrobium sp.]
MALNRQPDLFAKDIQPDLLEDQPAQAYRADPDKVRRELNRMLAEARAAQSMRPATVKLYQTLFPQMSNWLPDAEAAQLRFAFETELERLKAA